MSLTIVSILFYIVSKFPSSSRDLNILISQSYSYAEIETVLLNSKIQFLHILALANTFEGKGIPDGSISMTLRFMFQSSVKSLTESEISTSMDKAFHLLNKAFKKVSPMVDKLGKLINDLSATNK